MGWIKTWLHDWWITIRWSSPLTRAGRELRRCNRDLFNSDMDNFVLATPPKAAIDCRTVGCRWGDWTSERCECFDWTYDETEGDA